MTLPSALVARSAAVASSSRSSTVLAQRVHQASTAASPACSSSSRLAARAGRRSYASVSPSVSDPKLTSKLPQGSDSIWAISSVVVFGSLFFYLTSPKKGGHGDAHGSHGSSSSSSHSDDHAAKAEAAADDSDSESGVDFVVVEAEPEIKISTAGGEALKARETDDHGKQVSANNKAAPLPNKGEVFAHAVASAKDGNPISDPKAVVQRAHAEKAEKYQSPDGRRASGPESTSAGTGSKGKGAKVEDAEDEE